MITVNNIYPNTPAARFDMEYYLSTHIPMAKRLLGSALKEVTVERGVSGGAPGSQPAYLVNARMVFNSMNEFISAIMPHLDTLRNDIPRYTDITPVIQISEIID